MQFLIFFAYYINGASVTRYKNNKNSYKRLQNVTDRLLQQKPYAKNNDRNWRFVYRVHNVVETSKSIQALIIRL